MIDARKTVMEHHFACPCGKVLPVSEGMAGAQVTCSCGAVVSVPPLSQLRAQSSTDLSSAITTSPDKLPWQGDVVAPPTLTTGVPREVIAPTPATLRAGRGSKRTRPTPVVAALTSQALWIQDTWQTRALRLKGLEVDRGLDGQELLLVSDSGSLEELSLTFASAEEREHWWQVLEGQQQLAPEPTPKAYVPEGVSLVRQPARLEHVDLGRVESSASSRRAVDRGVQLRAAMRGANAVVEVHRQRCPDLGRGGRSVSGVAIRVDDASAQNRLRLRWYGEEVGALVRGMLVLLVIQMGLILLVFLIGSASKGSLVMPRGETAGEALTTGALWLGIIHGWPVVLLVILRVWRWPQLLVPVGIAVFAVTAGRGLAVILAHMAAAATAIRVAGSAVAGSQTWVVFDPFTWGFIIAGIVLFVAACRLAREAPKILPAVGETISAPPRLLRPGLLTVTGLYGLSVIGFAAYSRYAESSYLLQPGVDAQKEQQGLLAINEGLDHANKGNLPLAEQSWQRSLQIWETLSQRRPSPVQYRRNLAMTLNNLGWLREKQGRAKDAEAYYRRSLAVARELMNDPQVDDDFKRIIADTSRFLDQRKDDDLSRKLDEKSQVAGQKYEAALIKEQAHDVQAETLCQEAIALWEEVLPQALNETYRKWALGQLTDAYLRLGEIRMRHGKRPLAEPALKKAIDYGQKAVLLDPGRPLVRNNLERARQTLAGVQEQMLLDENDALARAERYAEAADRYQRSVDEQEAKVRAAKGDLQETFRLAGRLGRLAWFLAHCSDHRVRDTKAAVKYARRATQLQPMLVDRWYTLAMVQYRNGDWADSLQSLEQVRARAGSFVAVDWLLMAMNRQQLKQPAEARDALRQADAWIADQERKAADDPLSRIQYELMRPNIENLRREADNLIHGKEREKQGVG
jgi:tetratricopeptide (TPR) repeat protein